MKNSRFFKNEERGKGQYGNFTSLKKQTLVRAVTSSAQVIHRFPYDAIHTYHPGGALQLGPDRKIYLSHYFLVSLSVIESPDSLGAACDYTVNSIYCGGVVFDGLPNLIRSYWLDPRANSFTNTPAAVKTTPSCFTSPAPISSNR